MKKVCFVFWLTLSGLSYSETRYVVKDNPSATTPYTNWTTAAATIQDAVDVSASSDTIWVTNGVYDASGRTANGALTNRVVINKPVIVCSVNGAEYTNIEGAGPEGDSAVRCVYLGSNATLIGFTLASGYTRHNAVGSENDACGAGAFCEPSAVLSSCVISGNWAEYGAGGVYGGTLSNCTLRGNGAFLCGGGAWNATLRNCTLMNNFINYGFGGGAYSGTLYNCVLTGNQGEYGGGAHDSVLYDCTLAGNHAVYEGGGAYNSTLYNSIVYHNTASGLGSNVVGCVAAYSCTSPDPGGEGNTANDPGFIDDAGEDLHLQSNSPCINTGINQDWMTDSADLDGNLRIRKSRADMGAYESDHWGQFSDVDADGLSDWIEVYRTGTNPTNAASYLGMEIPVDSDHGNMGIVVRWQSVAGKTYKLMRSTNLTESFASLHTNLNAVPPINVYTDKTVTGQGPWFYRVGVE